MNVYCAFANALPAWLARPGAWFGGYGSYLRLHQAGREHVLWFWSLSSEISIGRRQVRLVLDDGQRVLPPYVSGANFDYESREKGALHAWDSGVLQTPRGEWTRLEARLEGYPPGARRVLVILQARARDTY